MTKGIFKTEATRYWSKGIKVIPIKPESKAGISGWNHFLRDLPIEKTRQEWLEKYADHGIGVLTSQPIGDSDEVLCGIDIDDDSYVGVISKMVGSHPTAKKGQKGLTIFVRAPKGIKKQSVAGILDILANSICVIPPTIHPATGKPYTWIGEPLNELDWKILPLVSEKHLHAIVKVLSNENHAQIMTGRETHQATLSLLASLAGEFGEKDKDLLLDCICALFPDNYQGDTLGEIDEMYESARSKGLGSVEPSYDPTNIGPIPYGYTENSSYVFLDQQKKILTCLSAASLMTESALCDMAPSAFWMGICPKTNKSGKPVGPDARRIGDLLMQECKKVGPFNPSKIRGSGIWLEDGEVVRNLSGPTPKSQEYTYVRFHSIKEPHPESQITGEEILNWFRLFNWSMPKFENLLLGWVSIAPICGCLDWRPHIFINGPKNTGKTTLINGIAELLSPVAISPDGSSTEAGIRQSIKADSRPILLDEFESDQNSRRMHSILKLARSASSSKSPVLRGSPEGKAMQFLLNTTFCFGAIIPIRGSNADKSRIVNLDLRKHDNSQEDAFKVRDGLNRLSQSSGFWTCHMAERATCVLEAIDVCARTMPPGIDSRHAQNMGTLIGAAFVAIQGKAPSEDQAKEWVSIHDELIQHLGSEHDTDDAYDCLQALLLYKPTQVDYTIGSILQEALKNQGGSNIKGPELLTYGIALHDNGFIVSNTHPEIKKMFRGTVWESGNWSRSLQLLPGAQVGDEYRARFDGIQTRCVYIPSSCLEKSSIPDIEY